MNFFYQDGNFFSLARRKGGSSFGGLESDFFPLCVHLKLEMIKLILDFPLLSLLIFRNILDFKQKQLKLVFSAYLFFYLYFQKLRYIR